jgi:hypothetical protein
MSDDRDEFTKDNQAEVENALLGLPELLVVACPSCNEVEVKEEKRVA